MLERYLSGEEPEADDHGLLGWCFDGTGGDEPPFREWRERDLALWAACEERVRAL